MILSERYVKAGMLNSLLALLLHRLVGKFLPQERCLVLRPFNPLLNFLSLKLSILSYIYIMVSPKLEFIGWHIEHRNLASKVNLLLFQLRGFMLQLGIHILLVKEVAGKVDELVRQLHFE